MRERGLAHVIGFAAALGDHGVGGTGEDDESVEALLLEELAGFVGEQVVGRDVDVKRGGPHRVGDNTVRRRRCSEICASVRATCNCNVCPELCIEALGDKWELGP